MERWKAKDVGYYNYFELRGGVSIDEEYSVFGGFEEKRLVLLVVQTDIWGITEVERCPL